MLQLPTPPNPADVRKFLLALKVPPAEARYFAGAPHIDWAEDISEVLHFGVGRQVVYPQYPYQTLAEFFKRVAPELVRVGVSARRLAKPKKGVPAGHDAYLAEFSRAKHAPVRHLFTSAPNGTTPFACARDLDAALRAFGLGVYLDLRWLDASSTATRVMSAREWDRVAKWLGEGVRDRLFVRADRVPAERDAALQFQYELWTGTTDPRDEDESVWSARDCNAARLSPGFLDRHRADLDAYGPWAEQGSDTQLEITWDRFATADQSLVPLGARVVVSASPDEPVGCSVGSFDPPPGTFELLRAFAADSAAYVTKALAVVGARKRSKPRRGRYQLYWYSHGSAEVSLGFWYRGMSDTDKPERCFFDPETGDPR